MGSRTASTWCSLSTPRNARASRYLVCRRARRIVTPDGDGCHTARQCPLEQDETVSPARRDSERPGGRVACRRDSPLLGRDVTRAGGRFSASAAQRDPDRAG